MQSDPTSHPLQNYYTSIEAFAMGPSVPVHNYKLGQHQQEA